MKRVYIKLTYCTFILTLLISNAIAQQVFKATSTSIIGYLEYLPQDYGTNSGKYPVVIFLHGIGERGTTSTDPTTMSQSITSVAKLGPPMYVKNGAQFPFILISPQLKSNLSTWPTWYVDEVIEHVKTYLRIDESRIYVTGLSLGGGGAWTYAQSYPHKIAALAPVCGGYNSPSLACNIAGSNVPVWAFHGDKDTTVPMSKTVNMINAINSCIPIPVPLSLLTIYSGVAHNAWDKAYRIDHTIHNPNVYEWMMLQTNRLNGLNNIPTANAGADITKTLPVSSVTLNGSGTDILGAISSYSWKQIDGPSSATLSGASNASVTVSNLVAGVYTFRLRVTDNGGDSDSDYVKVTVQSGTANVAPVANAGPNKTITLPTSSVTINGTGTDSDGTIASYNWTKISGGTVSMSGASTANLTASGLAAGTYGFRLTVTDNNGATKSDDMNVIVNMPPLASAGTDKSINLPDNALVLNGSGNDPDGTITSFQWTKVSGGTATMTGGTTPNLQASNLTEGAYTFRLTVTDNRGAKKTDDAKVTVNSSAGVPPVANAGKDRIVSLPITSVNITGGGTDPDGTIVSFQWTQVSGPSCTLANTATNLLKISNVSSGTCVFRLKVTDNTGATDSDDVTIKFNYPPTANAGPDKTLTLPTSSITLYGSGSDPDGTVTCKWAKLSGSWAALSGKETPTLTVTELTEGIHTFKLIVTDNIGIRKVDYVDVTVLAESGASNLRTASSQGDQDSTSVGINDEKNAFLDSSVESYLKFDPTSWDENIQDGYHVVIFSELGERLFSGVWKRDFYYDVFRKKGLYLFRLFKDGRLVDTGKIYKVE